VLIITGKNIIKKYTETARNHPNIKSTRVNFESFGRVKPPHKKTPSIRGENTCPILGKKNFTPPDEISVIKDYIKRRYDSKSRVKIEKSAVIVSVPSSTLAATIYLERQALIEHCQVKLRLVVRTGG
jgi:hypothetical protein